MWTPILCSSTIAHRSLLSDNQPIGIVCGLIDEAAGGKDTLKSIFQWQRTQRQWSTSKG